MRAESGVPSHPLPRITSGTKHGKNDNPRLFEHKENLIGEAPDEGTAKVVVHNRKLAGIAEYGMERGVYVQQEIRTETGDAFLVLVKGVAQFRFCLGADDQFKRHRRLLMRSLTMSQGDPLEGSAW